MSVDPKFGRYCDSCGRGIENAVRIHLGRDYCRACYQTNFVKDECAECRQPMRRHRHAEGPHVCKACVRSKRTCIRCGKFTPRAGRLVGSGAVCNACSPHFRAPRACTSCGKMSTTLSRPLFAGLQEEVCESCRRRLTHATCSFCRRYRPISEHEEGDAPRCKDCAKGQEPSHPCPQCGAAVRGGGLARCRACVNRTAVGRQAALVSAELEHEWAREVWVAFVEHELERDPVSPKLPGRVDHAASFFRLLAGTFESQREIDAHTLAARIDSRILRRHLVASRFAIGALALGPTAESRADATERRRIDALLKRSQDRPYVELLTRYRGWLLATGVATRTARLYLRAAEAFCSGAGVRSGRPWRTEDAVRVLSSLPGHAASLGRFFAYCSNQLGWEVSMPPKSQWAPDTRKKTAVRVARLRKSIGEATGSPDRPPPTREIARVLSLALGVPAARLLRERAAGQVSVQDDGAIRVTADAAIAPADALYPYAQLWARTRNP